MSSLITTDRQYLSDNLLCLVSNAVKFSHRGATIDVHLRLENGTPQFPSRPSVSHSPVLTNSPSQLSSQRSDQCSDQSVQMVVVTVEDTGVGLTAEARETLFLSTSQVRDSGGTGLGLFSLAKRVEALGGEYGVQGRPDKAQGSLFWFTFPYHPCTLSGTAS
jgi:signal transduction histidine kinase